MTLEQMKNALGIQRIPEAFADIYNRLEKRRAAYILSDAFIRQTLEQNQVMLPYMDQILAAARQLRQNEALCLLVCLLETWVLEGGRVNDSDYEAPAGTGLAYDFLHLFPAIPTISGCADRMRKRGVPEDVIADTLREYDYCIDLCNTREARPAFTRDRLNWICGVIRGELIRIGRLKYDLPGTYMTGFRVYRNRVGALTILANNLKIHRSGRVLGSAGCADPEGSFLAALQETETTVIGHPFVDGLVKKEKTALSKADWELCLSESDPVLKIHIPPGGGFDKKALAQTYQRTREVMATCYPDRPFKAFFCSSWLLSLDLREILKPESNILAFQRDFTPVPLRGGDATTFSFVFGNLNITRDMIPSLPENSSLQRAIKKRYLDGGYVHQGAGFFF